MKTKKVININDFEAILQNYHNSNCWDETKKWFNQFGNNISERSRFLKANMYTSKPITTADGGGKVKEFSVLQGDAIKTKAAITSYLLPIDGEELGDFGFVAIFEEISYIENELLQSVQRIASLSRVGWHLLNAFLVNHFTRPSSDDITLRQSKHDKEWGFYE
jgi:hypothetical protein